MTKKEIAPERISGLYAGIPHAVMDSPAFVGASDNAKSLLFSLMRQLNGRNNGRLHMTGKWMAKQGWPSSGMNHKFQHELIERGLIIETKKGGLNIGASLFAVTWLKISNFVGLDITSNSYHPGLWGLCKLPPTPRRRPPKKREKPADYRSSTTPTIGVGGEQATPTIGSKNTVLSVSTTPTAGNNVFMPLPTRKLRRGKQRIVGKAGRSGNPASRGQV